MITPTEKIWRNGELINWNDATVHVLTHALHYGSSVFEGIRCYETATGPALFRIKEHVRRMFDSAKRTAATSGASLPARARASYAPATPISARLDSSSLHR